MLTLLYELEGVTTEWVPGSVGPTNWENAINRKR